ncbi:MAG: hypothetical protein LBN06_02790 [Prevotellaceae bacterium]|jgi:hypothetical protein|nr:hypothetical protein [Prevotellaceae bacterium]
MATIPKGQVSGRPRKSEAAKRKYKVSTKLTAPEYYAFKAKLRAARLIASEYIRQAIEKSEVVERLSPEHREEIRQLVGMVEAGYLELPEYPSASNQRYRKKLRS